MVCVLFIIYTLLWAIKRRTQKRATGIDPEVFGKSSSNLQRYMIKVFDVVRIYTIAIIVLHALDIQFFALFKRFGPIDYMPWKMIGFIIGLAGLTVCILAQIKMGASW